MTVEKHTYHRIYELFSVNEPIADWIAMTDFDTPYPLMLTLMEAKEDEEREAPLEAVIWAAAEIAAAANLRDYRNIPSRLRRRIRSLHCPHPIPELALEGIAGIRERSEIRKILEEGGCLDEWLKDLDELSERLRAASAVARELALPTLVEADAYFKAHQPMPPEAELTSEQKREYLYYGSYLLFHEDYRLYTLAASSLGYGLLNGIYDVMLRIIHLHMDSRAREEGLTPEMLISKFESVRYYGVVSVFDFYNLFPMLGDPSPFIRALAVNKLEYAVSQGWITDYDRICEELRKASGRFEDLNFAYALNSLYDRCMTASGKRFFLPFSDHLESKLPMTRTVNLLSLAAGLGIGALVVWGMDWLCMKYFRWREYSFMTAQWLSAMRAVWLTIFSGSVLYGIYKGLYDCHKNEEADPVWQEKLRPRVWKESHAFRTFFKAFMKTSHLRRMFSRMEPDAMCAGALLLFGREDGLEAVFVEGSDRITRILPDGTCKVLLPDGALLYAWRKLCEELMQYHFFLSPIGVKAGMPKKGTLTVNLFTTDEENRLCIRMTELDISALGSAENLMPSVFQTALPSFLELIDCSGGTPPESVEEQVPALAENGTPACLSGFELEDGKSVLSGIGLDARTVYRQLRCPCGCERFLCRGVSSGADAVYPVTPPLSLLCVKCGREIPLFDENMDGYNSQFEPVPGSVCGNFTVECAYRFVAGLEYAFEDGLLTDEPDVRLHCADYFTGITVYGIGEDGEVHILYKGNCA